MKIGRHYLLCLACDREDIPFRIFHDRAEAISFANGLRQNDPKEIGKRRAYWQQMVGPLSPYVQQEFYLYLIEFDDDGLRGELQTLFTCDP